MLNTDIITEHRNEHIFYILFTILILYVLYITMRYYCYGY